MNHDQHLRQSEHQAPPLNHLFLNGSVDPDPDLLSQVLDELDYGLCVLTEDGFIEHANQIATDAIGEGSVLRTSSNRLQACDSADREVLSAAIKAALRGRRGLVLLGKGNDQRSMALTPLSLGESDRRRFGNETRSRCLLVMGKRNSYEQLSLVFFAQLHGLTPAEIVVLGKLCNGDTPKVIAMAVGVAVSTVRTQISSVRSKTQTQSIRDLTRRISALPPVTMLLKPSALN